MDDKSILDFLNSVTFPWLSSHYIVATFGFLTFMLAIALWHICSQD